MTQTIEIRGGGGGTIEIGGGGERSASIEIAGAEKVTPPKYAGPYEFTPTQETQTAHINRKMGTQDITINPIPKNYGLVTYNGSIITIT